jgi:hypothetical protein
VRAGIDKKPFEKMVPPGSDYSRRGAKESSDEKEFVRLSEQSLP